MVNHLWQNVFGTFSIRIVADCILKVESPKNCGTIGNNTCSLRHFQEKPYYVVCFMCFTQKVHNIDVVCISSHIHKSTMKDEGMTKTLDGRTISGNICL